MSEEQNRSDDPARSETPDLPSLFAQLVEGTISEEQFRTLAKCLAGNPSAQDQYREYIELHAMLLYEHQPQPAAITVPESDLSLLEKLVGDPSPTPGVLGTRQPMFSVWPLTVFALLCVLGVVTYQLMRQDAAKPPVQQAQSAPPLDQKPAGMSSIRLRAGSAEVKLPGVGHVIVDGTTEFTLLDSKRARLDRGRIKMRVTEKTGRGFVVETPFGNVMDLGTEFGLDVSGKGKAGVVVFDGAVDLQVAEAADKPGFSRVERLQSGEGLAFSEGGKLDRIMSIVTGRSATFQPSDESIEGGSRPLIVNVSDNLPGATTRKFYEIVPGGFGEDARAYVDRVYQWNGLDETGIPSFLLGADYVLPFNDDKAKQLELTLTLAAPATVYVLFDDRGTPPKWLRHGFVDTGDDIGMDEDQGDAPRKHKKFEFKLGKGAGQSIDYVFSIWKRDIHQAGPVFLGPRDGQPKSRSMYGIVVTPLRPLPVASLSTF